MTKPDAIAKAIDCALGEGSVAYSGNAVDSVYEGFRRVADAVTGREYTKNGSQNVDGHSLCQSIDGMADAIRGLSEAVRTLGRT